MSSAAAGGLRPGRPDQHYEPPSGGQAVPGPRSVIRARTVIISGTGPGVGVFVYSPTPGPGNLVESLTAASGADPYGNATLAGYTTYNNAAGTFFATNLTGGQLTEWTATSEAGPYTFNGSIVSLSTSLPIGVTSNFTWQWATITGHVMSGPGIGINPLLSLISTSSAGAPMLLSLIAFTAGDQVLRTRIPADTSDRWHIDSNGKMSWGPGNVSPTTNFYWGGTTNQLVSDFIAANVSGSAETWHAPTFNATSGWTNAAIGAALQYRFVAAPYNCMQWVGRIVAPAGIVAGQAITLAIPNAYRPNNQQDINAINVTTGAAVRLQQQTGGVLLYESGAASGDTVGIPVGSGLVSLDA